ncbi:MAG: hypothetical protein HRU15_12895 [Planctomycetes bacterium]|nr:hypothetical protein [Planctomycetota bacterium]
MAFHFFQEAFDPDFYRLYSKASREQWAVADLPWDKTGKIDEDYRNGLLGMLSPLIVSERGAMQACGTMLPKLREAGDHDSEIVMHAMMLDEARHWEGINQVYLALEGRPRPITDFKEALGINYVIMRCGDFDQWLWCIQICDIIAGVLYNNFKNTCESEPIVKMFDGFLKDEARHHRFCNLFFTREAEQFTLDQKKRYRKQGDKLIKKFENLMKNHLADYMSMMGCDATVAFEKVAKAVENQAKAYGF